MPLKTRLLYLLIGWLPAGLIYMASGFVNGNLWIVPESRVENFISFSPVGVWLYLMFYVYIPYTFLTANESKIKILCSSFVLSSVISGIIFVLFPSSIRYPDFEINGGSAWCLDFVRDYDTEQNCFPSLHGSLITLCTIANWEKLKRLRSYTCIILTIAIFYSIIQIRRHVFIDLTAGISLAFLAWFFSNLILRRMKKHSTLI